jgi:DNA-binding transcriptional LysR family regulator
MVSRLTVADDLASRRLAVLPVKATLPTRDLLVIDHPQEHHGAACRAMLQLLERTFPLRAASARVGKTAG